jgi:hypothetical protein
MSLKRHIPVIRKGQARGSKLRLTAVLPTDAAYGSDRSGLISGYLFHPGTPGQAMDTVQAGHWLEGREAANGALPGCTSTSPTRPPSAG